MSNDIKLRINALGDILKPVLKILLSKTTINRNSN